MHDFLPLTVLHDELAISYRNRLCRVNDWGESVPSVQKMASKTGFQCHSKDACASADVLAWISREPIHEFIRGHTMLPLQRSVISATQRSDNDYATNTSLLQKKANCATRSHLYFCPECVADDVRKSGAPFWRRSHQIPGLYWCLEHHSALRFIPHPGVKVSLPSDVLGVSREVDRRQISDAKANPFVQRFIELCIAMLDLKQPLRDYQIHKILKRRVFHLQETNRSDDLPLKSGMLKLMYKTDWLNDVFTRTCKDPNRASENIESTLIKFSPGIIGIGYALLFAGLFDTSASGLNALLLSGGVKSQENGFDQRHVRYVSDLIRV
jgi:hypothetical protein